MVTTFETNQQILGLVLAVGQYWADCFAGISAYLDLASSCEACS